MTTATTMRRWVHLGIVTACLVALMAAPPAPAALPDCTDTSAQYAVGAGHDHFDVSQHEVSCNFSVSSFLPLVDELELRDDVVLGEIDVKKGIAVVGIAFPEAGLLVFDVADPARPRFLSWYRSSECEGTVIDVDCGAYVDLSSDAKTAFLSVQQVSVVPGAVAPPGAKPAALPSVEVVDLSDPMSPRLSQIYPVVSDGGVHTSRTHVIPEEGPGPRVPGEYLFSVANRMAIEISRLETSPLGPRLTQVTRIAKAEAHDTFLQNDPLTGRTYMYLAGGLSTGFEIYDVTVPDSPELRGVWDITPQCAGDWYAHTIDVAVRGGRRYVTMPAELFDFGQQSEEDQAEGCGRVMGNGDKPGPLWIVDATDFSRLGQPGDSADLLRLKSENALVTTWTNSAGRAGGHLLFSPHNQQIVENRIYISGYHAGITVLDASAAFAGRPERPVELGFIVPSGATTRPIYEADVQPVTPFFCAFLSSRPSIWDMQFYEGYVLAADMVGGFYSLQYAGDAQTA